MTVRPIPRDWPVQPLKPGGLPPGVRMTCGACGLSWDDSLVTSMTPTPSARCPFENFHVTLDDWVERFKAQGLNLDEVVEDHKAREAEVINQGGLGDQVQYLISEYGEAYLETLLDEEEEASAPSPNVALTIRKSSYIDNWYLIERKKREGVHGLRIDRDGNGSYIDSARISDADVEGTAAEMRAIASAIEASEFVSYYRCAVDARTPQVRFYSPRNSQRHGIVSRADAVALAQEIRLLLGDPPQRKNT